MKDKTHYSTSHKPLHGFTLIELLVVIAVIAGLLAIIAPALQMARFRAQEIICKTNFRQWGLASNTYAHENAEQFPRFDISTGTGRNTWDVANEFVSQMMGRDLPPEVWFCPVQITPEQRDVLRQGEDAVEVYLRWEHDPASWFSRIYYNWWVPRVNGGLWVPTEPSTRGSFPSRTTSRMIAHKPIMSDTLGGPEPVLQREEVYGGHQRNGVLRSTSVLYGDGHVKTSLPSEIQTYYNGNYYNFY